MLEKIDFKSPALTKEEYKRAHDALIAELVDLQQQAIRENVGLVVLVEGWNGAGKGSRISDLVYNLDARSTSMYVTEDVHRKEEKLFKNLGQGVSGYYPFMQEFWKALGERGTITFYDRGWYIKTLQHLLFLLYGEDLGTKRAKLRPENFELLTKEMENYLPSIKSFEKQLANNGYTVVKLFLHISEEEQYSRLKELRDNPATRWRVSKEKLRRVKNYKYAAILYDELLEKTDHSFAPWTIVNAQDKRQANLDIAATLIKGIKKGLEKKRKADYKLRVQGETREEKREKPSILISHFSHSPKTPSFKKLDYTLRYEHEEYSLKLKKEQKRFHALELEMYLARIPLMIMFEGWDAAGKGGAIKRLAKALDARSYQIFPSPSPTPPEKNHPHLWRYWTRLPKAGHVGIYDRSWYGRVLVERVEGFATVEEWSRAYDEINEFERDMVVNWGALLVKFWVEISQEEQLKRFTERQNDPAKQWKINEDDWRNREKAPEYRAAAEDMFALTSTSFAPWTILESENKYYARVKTLQTVNDILESRLH